MKTQIIFLIAILTLVHTQDIKNFLESGSFSKLAEISKAIEDLTVNDIGDFDFLPGKPFEMSNPLLWTVNAVCDLKTVDDNDSVTGEMLKGTGSLNGKDVGKKIELSVKNGDSLAIGASSWAKVKITNKGQNTIHAKCRLKAETKDEILFVKSLIDELLSIYTNALDDS
jgi:hypothetical protein